MRDIGCDRFRSGRLPDAPVVFEDELNRDYRLKILSGLAENKDLFPYCGSMRLRTACSWLIGASEFPSIRSAFLHDLTNYDAAYLALAMKLNLPLATTDKRLQAAIAAVGLEVVKV